MSKWVNITFVMDCAIVTTTISTDIEDEDYIIRAALDFLLDEYNIDVTRYNEYSIEYH